MSAAGTAVLDRPLASPSASASVSRPLLVLLIWAATAIAGYVLYRQVSTVDIGPVLASANWWWVAVAVGCFGLSLAGAALNLIGTSPVRLGFPRTYGVQVAAGFVRLISPTAVGGAALNARYVQQAGASTRVAVATVGTAQTMQLVTTLALLAVLGPLSGTDAVPVALRGGAGLAVLTVVALTATVMAAVAVASLPRLRGRLKETAAAAIAQARLGLATRSPARRLLLAGGGSLLLTAGLVLALTASVAAMGGTPAPVSIGVAFLVGSAVGSLMPTPAGIGTVEAALVAALIASGQAAPVALPAVLVFRAVTVWLPVPMGWVAFDLLRRRGHL